MLINKKNAKVILILNTFKSICIAEKQSNFNRMKIQKLDS